MINIYHGKKTKAKNRNLKKYMSKLSKAGKNGMLLVLHNFTI